MLYAETFQRFKEETEAKGAKSLMRAVVLKSGLYLVLIGAPIVLKPLFLNPQLAPLTLFVELVIILTLSIGVIPFVADESNS